jgi:hypothetical protein
MHFFIRDRLLQRLFVRPAGRRQVLFLARAMNNENEKGREHDLRKRNGKTSGFFLRVRYRSPAPESDQQTLRGQQVWLEVDRFFPSPKPVSGSLFALP